jgi:hypothetical protein
MSRRRKLSGGFLIVAGYLLSPLSWWNDLYLNLPISYAFAWLVSLLYKPAFLAALISFYWITNVVGFILMHKGAEKVLSKKTESYSKRALLLDIAWSIGYTILIIFMVKLNIIRPVNF